MNKDNLMSSEKESKEKNVAEQHETLLSELNQRLSDAHLELDQHYKIFHQQEADRIVKNHVLVGSAVGLMPLPVVDIFALSTTQLNMVHQLSRHYQIDFDNKKAKSAIISLINGSLPTVTVISLSSFVKLIPGIGTLGGNASLILTGAAVTYATGRSFIKHFNEGGTIEDFNAKKYAVFFKDELKKGRDFALRNKKRIEKHPNKPQVTA
jgi:uncharacterized protein (DUF697 family)